jgi:hypothetical protein
MAEDQIRSMIGWMLEAMSSRGSRRLLTPTTHLPKRAKKGRFCRTKSPMMMSPIGNLASGRKITKLIIGGTGCCIF